MLGKILPILLAIGGVGAGVGAGLALKPETEDSALDPACETSQTAKLVPETPPADQETARESEYVKLNNQFVVPVVGETLVDALVVMALSVEVSPGMASEIYTREPKLRDAFLQVMFDHANIGGFEGTFTNANNLDILRAALTETAQNLVGSVVMGVLITDIARQDI